MTTLDELLPVLHDLCDHRTGGIAICDRVATHHGYCRTHVRYHHSMPCARHGCTDLAPVAEWFCSNHSGLAAHMPVYAFSRWWG